jgi:hypothetical protein
MALSTHAHAGIKHAGIKHVWHQACWHQACLASSMFGIKHVWHQACLASSMFGIKPRTIGSNSTIERNVAFKGEHRTFLPMVELMTTLVALHSPAALRDVIGVVAESMVRWHSQIRLQWCATSSAWWQSAWPFACSVAMRFTVSRGKELIHCKQR